MHVARVGSYRQRSRKATAATKQLRDQRRSRVACQTHDAIEDFESNLKVTASYDDLTVEVESSDSSDANLGSTRFGRRDIQPDDGLPEQGDARMRRWRSAGAFGASSQQTMRSTSGFTELTIPPMEKDAHEMRPPSPLSRYDYGCISQRPRSVLGQRRVDRGDDLRPKHRQSQGFYFPGAQYKQGPYGFSLLDPILMAPKAAVGKNAQPPTRWKGDSGDIRPATAPEIDQRRSRGNPSTSASVPPTRGHSARADRMFHSIDRRREEGHIEQVAFENGVFEGRWRHPTLDGEPQQAALADLSWMNGSVDDMDEPHRLAHFMLLGLDEAMRAQRGKIRHLFAWEDQGPGILEPGAFLAGLLRLGIFDEGEVTEASLTKAMYLVDSAFDGRVNLVSLKRAVSIATALRIQRDKEAQEADQKDQEQKANMYHESLPVENVRVDRHPRSLYNFERSFEKFLRQQRDLLAQHGDKVT